MYVHCTCALDVHIHLCFLEINFVDFLLTQKQYRIGQLYMIARHSAEESKGGGDGVEVVVNEPCHDEKHGGGQYTEKRIYLTRCVVSRNWWMCFCLTH